MKLYPLVKRTFDSLGALIALLVLLMPIAVTAVLVRIRLGRPIFFIQERAGKGGRPIRIIKFRSMTNACDASGALLPDELRLTRFGRFLRASTLDELPELWNVLKGDMSLVGPRPLHLRYVPLYSARQRRRLEVHPGLTGWAVVKGRNALSWEERFELDVWYVDHRSFWLDLRILALTIAKVLRREGVSAKGHATMPEFRGSR